MSRQRVLIGLVVVVVVVKVSLSRSGPRISSPLLPNLTSPSRKSSACDVVDREVMMQEVTGSEMERWNLDRCKAETAISTILFSLRSLVVPLSTLILVAVSYGKKTREK